MSDVIRSKHGANAWQRGNNAILTVLNTELGAHNKHKRVTPTCNAGVQTSPCTWCGLTACSVMIGWLCKLNQFAKYESTGRASTQGIHALRRVPSSKLGTQVEAAPSECSNS